MVVEAAYHKRKVSSVVELGSLVGCHPRLTVQTRRGLGLGQPIHLDFR